MKYRCVWKIELEREVEADSEDEAREIIENIDCVHDGTYVSDSFEHVKVEKST